MPRTTALLSNFTAGELSGLLDGRVDINKYANGCRKLENMVALPWGPATRTPGTQHIAEVRDSSKATALIEFEFSTEQAYVIEASEQRFRFYKDKGQIESGGSPVEVVTPYLEADLLSVKWAQSADTLYLTHRSYAPRKLTRTSHTAWTLTTIDFFDGPYLPENPGTSTLALSGTSGSVTVTASAATDINGGAGFKSTDVGRLIRWKDPAGAWIRLKITAFTDTTHVTASVLGNAASAGTATAAWRLGLWSDTTGYPAAVTIHEERLVFGGATDFPQRVDGSKSSDFENFAPGTADGDAFAYTLGSDQVNAILWLASAERELIVGTRGAPFRIFATSGPLTPTNVTAKRAVRTGCRDLRPLAVANALLFVQRQGKRVRELAFRYDVDGYKAPDMTRLAEHVTKGGIVSWAYQEEPYSILWAARADGQLLGFTYERDEDVTAWHRHPRATSIAGTAGVVESVASIPGTGQDQLWLVVKRTIGGETKRYVEVMEDFPAEDADQADLWYVESGLSYDGDGVATDTLTGLDHLEGETVQILADGAVHPPQTVDGGAITLDYEVEKAQVGLGYSSVLQPMRLEAGAAEGTAQGKKKRIDKATVRLFRSLGMKLGRPGKLDQVPFRKTNDAMDAPPPLFTGDKEVTFPGTFDGDAFLEIRQEEPLPLTVTCLMLRLVTSDG